jgi:hypothetical protein
MGSAIDRAIAFHSVLPTLQNDAFLRRAKYWSTAAKLVSRLSLS